MSLLVAFGKEWKHSLRSYQLLIVVIVLVFFGLLSPFLAKLLTTIITEATKGQAAQQGLTIQMQPATVKDAIGQYVKNVEQFGILLAWLLAMGAIAQEKDKGTAAMILVKPVPRSVFIWAKFLNLLVLFTIAVVLAGAAGYYYTYLLFESMNILHWVVLNALIVVYLLVILAITLFCSTLTKSQLAAGGIAFAVMVIPGQVISILGRGNYLPGELITWGIRLMLGDTTTSWTAFGISIGLIIVPLLAAWQIFKRQEL